MIGSVFFRGVQSPIESKDNEQFRYRNYSVNTSEDGEREFVEVEPVALSLADDFNVVNNSIYRGQRSAPLPVRDSVDPVDLLQKYPETFNS